MGVLKKYEILVVAEGGSDIADCKREAIILSVKEQVTVIFEHNQKEYRVHYVDVMNCVRGKKGD